MFRKIATAVGYTKAPKTTFLLKHPVKGTKTLLAAKGLKGLVTTRSGAALTAAVAVPLGFLAARGMGRKKDRR